MTRLLRWCGAALIALLSVVCVSQEAEAQSVEEVIAAFESWEGTPEELQELYDALPEDIQAEIESQLPTFAYEGGVGLMGGYDTEIGPESPRSGGHFRAELSFGLTWAQGAYSLPIYYAMPEIPGPWALGFRVFASSDNFDSVIAGASLHWAYEYIGWTPFVDIGGVFRWDTERGSQGGAHLEVGYGNILVQGLVQVQYLPTDPNLLTVTAGVRIPWLLFASLGLAGEL